MKLRTHHLSISNRVTKTIEKCGRIEDYSRGITSFPRIRLKITQNTRVKVPYMSFQKAFSRYLQGTKYLGWSYRSIKLCSLKRIMQKFPSVIRFNIIKHHKKNLLLILSPSQTDSIRGRDLMMTDLKCIARMIYSREEIMES